MDAHLDESEKTKYKADEHTNTYRQLHEFLHVRVREAMRAHIGRAALRDRHIRARRRRRRVVQCGRRGLAIHFVLVAITTSTITIIIAIIIIATATATLPGSKGRGRGSEATLEGAHRVGGAREHVEQRAQMLQDAIAARIQPQQRCGR